MKKDNTPESFAARALHTLSSASGDLQALARLAYEYLENPVILSDKNWRTLAIYPEIDIPEDDDWMQFRHSGMLSLEVAPENLKADLAGAISAAKEPFFRHDPRMRYGRLYCNVTAGNHAMATVSILEYSRPFTQDDHAITAMLAEAVSSELQKREKLGWSRGQEYESFLSDLLDGGQMSPALVNERFKSLNIRLHRYLSLCAVDVRRFDSGRYSLSFFRDYLERIIPDSSAIVYNDTIVLLRSFNRADKLRNVEKLPDLVRFLTERHAGCGVSRCFEDLSELRTSYEQAMLALSLGPGAQTGQPFFFYDDLVLRHVSSLCAEHEDLLRLCSPKLLELMEYDRQHNTAFTKTLRAFFANGRNITQTALALNMHRNSAIYHLKKIEDILSMRLSGADELLYMELSFHFLEYAKVLA